MAVYELTFRFEADDDNEALHTAEVQRQILGGEFDPPLTWRRKKITVERLTRVVVTRMEVPSAH